MKVLTAEQMRKVDRETSVRHGIPSLELMENAGTQVAEFIRQRFPDFARRKIAVLCGKGNNGGDGLVAARLIRNTGARPIVFLFANPSGVRGDAATNLKRYQEISGDLEIVQTVSEWGARKSALSSADMILDALLGTGLRGPAEGLVAAVIEDVNRHPGRAVVVAVDIPSGLSSDSGEISGPAISADYTVTFTAPKWGQLRYPASSACGRLLVRGIGSPAALIEEIGEGALRWLEPGEFAGLSLRRSAHANKGHFGHALIVAGSVGKAGAAAMAAMAALRAGAGLVTVATPEPVLSTVAGFAPEVMTEPLDANESGAISTRCLEYGRFSTLLAGKSVLAIGPGLTTQQETQQFVRTVVAESRLPVILDADGINAFAGRFAQLRAGPGQKFALTPHPGEMGRLLGCAAKEVQCRRIEVAQEVAAQANALVILKGHQTVLATPSGSTSVNSTGNPGMASAGMGDVLTGMLAGLTAAFGTEMWDKVLALGVYLHGLAGDLAAAEIGEYPLVATDLVRWIPKAFAHASAEIEGA